MHRGVIQARRIAVQIIEWDKRRVIAVNGIRIICTSLVSASCTGKELTGVIAKRYRTSCTQSRQCILHRKELTGVIAVNGIRIIVTQSRQCIRRMILFRTTVIL